MIKGRFGSTRKCASLLEQCSIFLILWSVAVFFLDLKRRQPDDKILNADHVLIPSSILKSFVEAALGTVMPLMKNEQLADMINAGIGFDDKTAYNSLSQLREYLHLVVGPNAAELLVDAIRRSLEKSRVFETYA